MDYKIEELVNKVERLPTHQSVATKLIVLCSDSKTPLSKLIEIISSDQSIFSQILHLANSSYFNYPKQITSLEKAILILGFNFIRDVALSIAIYSLYQNITMNSDFNLNDLWEHSFLTGMVGKALAEKYDPEKKDVLFIGGLFHDIGKLVQHQLIEKDFSLIFIKSQRENEKLYILERKILGFHHGDIGGLLLKKWNLPDVIVNMIKFHHSPMEFSGEDEVLKMIRFTYLSNLLAHFLKSNHQELPDLMKLDWNFNHHFKFTKDEFKEIISFTKQFISNHKTLKQVIQN